MKNVKILAVRSAEAQLTLEKGLSAEMARKLTQHGEKQAHDRCEFLIENRMESQFDIVLTSGFYRADQTAAIIAGGTHIEDGDILMYEEFPLRTIRVPGLFKGAPFGGFGLRDILNDEKLRDKCGEHPTLRDCTNFDPTARDYICDFAGKFFSQILRQIITGHAGENLNMLIVGHAGFTQAMGIGLCAGDDAVFWEKPLLPCEGYFLQGKNNLLQFEEVVCVP